MSLTLQPILRRRRLSVVALCPEHLVLVISGRHRAHSCQYHFMRVKLERECVRTDGLWPVAVSLSFLFLVLLAIDSASVKLVGPVY